MGTDYTLYLRPFTSGAWAGILVFAAVIAASAAATAKHLLARSESAARLAECTLWLSFVVINAYYGGALTMFLSTRPDQPFANSTEGIVMYPRWKMIVVKDTVLIALGENYHPAYSDFIARTTDPAENAVADTYETALNRVAREEGTFLFGAQYYAKLHRLKDEVMGCSTTHTFVLILSVKFCLDGTSENRVADAQHDDLPEALAADGDVQPEHQGHEAVGNHGRGEELIHVVTSRQEDKSSRVQLLPDLRQEHRAQPRRRSRVRS